MKNNRIIPVLIQYFNLYKYSVTSYLISVLSVYIAIRITYSFFEIDFSDGKYSLNNHIVSHIRSFSDAVILSLPYCFIKSKRKIYFFLYLFLIDLILLSSIWYYRNFETVIPYTSFLMFCNLNGLIPSILASIKVQDIFIILPLIISIILYYSIFNKKENSRFYKNKYKYILFILAGALCIQINSGWNGYSGSGERRILLLRHHGLFHLINFDIKSHRACTADEVNQIRRFIEKEQRKMQQKNHIKKT